MESAQKVLDMEWKRLNNHSERLNTINDKANKAHRLLTAMRKDNEDHRTWARNKIVDMDKRMYEQGTVRQKDYDYTQKRISSLQEKVFNAHASFDDDIGTLTNQVAELRKAIKELEQRTASSPMNEAKDEPECGCPLCQLESLGMSRDEARRFVKYIIERFMTDVFEPISNDETTKH